MTREAATMAMIAALQKASSAANGALDGDRLHDFDFAAHNEQVRQTWAAFRAGRPARVPIFFGTNTRFFMFNASGANVCGLQFREYAEDPDVMFDALLRFQRWSRFNLLQDAELGLPPKWTITPDFQNYYEAAWLGCPVEYMSGQVPDTRPVYADAPERLMENGLPDPFASLLGRGRDYFEHFRRRAAQEEFLNRPIEVAPPGFGLGTDGVLTVACNLFGPDFVCTAMMEEPDRLRRLLAFITEATIARMLAWRRHLGLPLRADNFWFADDSIALISVAAYCQHVLPHHRRLCDAIAGAGPRGIHLCGDAARHFLTLRDELNIRSFDTGFPIDFAAVRRSLGPDVTIQGGPHVEFLRSATPPQIRQAVRDIFASGILAGGRFVLREGNNLAPYTPLENTEAMYHAGREFGGFDDLTASP